MSLPPFRSKTLSRLIPGHSVRAPNGKRVTYQGVWAGFDAEVQCFFWTDIFAKHIEQDHIRVLLPFAEKQSRNQLALHKALAGKWDVYLTGENTGHRTSHARASIGFRPPTKPNEFRFPYWMWHFAWPGYEVKPSHLTFGTRYPMDHLMKSMNEVHGPISRDAFEAAQPKAALMTSHLRAPRDTQFRLCNAAMGCDGFGRAFTPTSIPKIELLSPYLFNLCPENELAEGYVTEKIPEAFLANCVPITWCRPDDLALDFNPKAVVNLHGLSEAEIAETLKDLAQNYDRFNALRSQPLLLQPPDLAPLRNFLSTVLNDGPASANQPGAS